MREELPAPPRIADYELLRPIGRGSYGVVWLARSVTGLYRAVKIVWRESFEDPQPYEREFRGIKEFAAISLVAPRQLALLHVGRNDAEGFFYYVMELADDVESGREIDPTDYIPNTLKEVRARRHRLPAAEAIALAVELAEGLAELHQRGLVHRDIKPSNIILVGGAPKLADIGLVASTRNSELTMSRVGNPGYMPPDFPGVPSADVFGLGRVLYELVMGRERDDFPALPDLADIPDRKELLELNEVLLRACAPDPTRRYADASALLDDLRLLQAGKSVRRLRAAERHLSRALRGVAVLAIVATLAAGGAWIERTLRKEETDRRRAAEQALADLTRKTYYSASLGRAQRALEIGDFGAARRILDETLPRNGEPDLRHFEWHALWHEAQGDDADVLIEKGPALPRLALSPDSRLLAIESADTRALLWDAATLQPARIIKGVHRIAGFTADGKWLLGSNPDLALQRWDAASGRPDPEISPGRHYILGSTTGDGIVGMLSDLKRTPVALRIWNSRTHVDDARLAPVFDPSRAWEFGAPTGLVQARSFCVVHSLARQSGQNTWRIQAHRLPDLQMIWKRDYVRRFSATAISNDERTLILAFADSNELEALDPKTGELRWRQTIELSSGQALAFSADDAQLAIGSGNAGISIASARDGAPVNHLQGQGGAVLALQWTPHGNALFSTSSAGDLRHWKNPAIPRPKLVRLVPMPQKFRTVALSSDGGRFAGMDGVNRITVGATPKGLSFEPATLASDIPLFFAPTGMALTTLATKGVVQEWDLQSPATPKTETNLALAGAEVVCASASANREKLVVTDSSGQIHFWDWVNRRPLGSLPTQTGFVWWINVSPSGEFAITAGSAQTIKVWSVTSTRLAHEWATGRALANHADFSPNGQWLAVAYVNGDIEIRDTKAFQVRRTWKTDSGFGRSLAFSPDSRRLFCGSSNGELLVYDTVDWKEIGRLSSASRKGGLLIESLKASADASTVLAYREDGLVHAWTRR